MNQTISEQLNNIIGDPIDGPYEGEDYWIDPDGTIQVAENNIKLAATILRKTNNSNAFDTKLVKIGQRGDSILLGFDTLLDAAPVYKTNIGFKKDTFAEVKKDVNGKFCLYLNAKRTTRIFNKLSTAKTYLKKLGNDLQNAATESDNQDE